MPDTFLPLLDGRLYGAVAAVMAAGLARGFSGFGAAMVIMPTLGGLYSPVVAFVVLTLVDAVAPLPLLADAMRRCRWRDIAWLLLPYGAMLQIGIAILASGDPLSLRLATVAIILVAVAAIASGWRYHRRPRPVETVAIGGVAGLTGGATGIGGPPVILFWLGGQDDGPVVRANVIVFFFLTSIFSIATLLSRDLLTAEATTLALVLMPAYALAILSGAVLYRRTRAALFRRIVLALVALVAVASLAL